MMTVKCLIMIAGLATQSLEFEFTSAESSKFMHGYGYTNGYTRSELEAKACQDLEYTLGFQEDQE